MLWLHAAAGQCPDEYISAGIVSSRVFHAGDVMPLTSPRYGVTAVTGTPFTAMLNVKGSYVQAYDGDITSGQNGMTTAPSTSWTADTRPAWVAFQVTLDRAYDDVAAGVHGLPCASTHNICISVNVHAPKHYVQLRTVWQGV